MSEPLAFDPGAELTLAGDTRLVEATARELPDGRGVVDLYDEAGEVVATVSFRPGFLLRREHGSAEAAA